MPDPAKSAESNKSPGLDPDLVAAQSAVLAAHLQRSGVQFLPKFNPDRVAELKQHFDSPSATAKPAETTPPEKPVVARTNVAQPQVARANVANSQAQLIVDDVQASYAGPALADAERVAKLDALNEQVAACTLCSKLAGCRTNTVFGEGAPSPRVAFFGEGPGADEDRTGRPFVGKAGQLLTKMIEACSFKREDVYIFNTVKCRPPGNRNPEPGEIEQCRPFFEQQLQILRPEYIVCLGAVSSQTLLRSKLPVGRLRGKFHRYFDSKVLVTYHPAYLLRNPAAKKAAWQDLQIMLRDAGIAT